MSEKKILKFVTSNKNKVLEMRKHLENTDYDVVQANLGYPEMQADTLEEVVHHGLEVLRHRGEDNILIEDSGMFIESLNGFPGVYSAYVFDTIGAEGILALMKDKPNRKAFFKAVIGVLHNGEIHTREGICPGSIGHEMKGTAGFGYDPIYLPDGETRTFAQMIPEDKNGFSHRGKAAEALTKLLEELK